MCTSVTCMAPGWIRLAALHRQLEGEPDRPLGAHARVDRALRGDLVRRALAQHAALADVRTLGVLADDDEIVRLGVAGRRPDERSLVDVQVEIEPHLQQQAALDDTGRNIGRADGTEQDGVEAAQLVERRIRQDLAVTQVSGAAEVVVGGVEIDPGSAHDLQRFGGHLWADAVAADHCNSISHGPRCYVAIAFSPMATTQLSRCRIRTAASRVPRPHHEGSDRGCPEDRDGPIDG